MHAPPPAVSEERETGNYFVATYPPFPFWTAGGAEEFAASLERPPADSATPVGMYAHVPFCVQRCRYCYYLSHDDRPGEMKRYVRALAREVALYAGSEALRGRRMAFGYFGGGTPSLLPTRLVEELLHAVREGFPWEPGAELSFECAPRSVNRRKLEAMRRGGITRLNLGAQQMNDEVLRRNGRVHLVRDVERAYEAIRAVGFDVVNLDLMVGLVGETEDTFHGSLERVLALEPDCVTIYQMEIPPNTPLFRDVQDGRVAGELPSWETKRTRLHEGFARLEAAGYRLRSAYTAVRDPERHRFDYQDLQYRGADLIGLGLSSFSYLAGVHHQNASHLPAYVDAVEKGRLPLGRGHALDDEERMVREMVLQLKLGAVPAAPFRGRFGVDLVERFAEPLERLDAKGWLTYSPEGVELTREGLLRVDGLLSQFYLPRHAVPPGG